MDLITVLRPFFDWLIDYFNTTIVLGGYSFTIGALCVWSILAVVLIGFMKGLAR